MIVRHIKPEIWCRKWLTRIFSTEIDLFFKNLPPSWQGSYIYFPFMQRTLLRNVFEKSYHMTNVRDCLHWRIILLWIFHTFKGLENSSYPRKHKNYPQLWRLSHFPYLKSLRIFPLVLRNSIIPHSQTHQNFPVFPLI